MQCYRYLEDSSEPFLECHISIIADSIVVILNNSQDDIGRTSMATKALKNVTEEWIAFVCRLKTWDSVWDPGFCVEYVTNLQGILAKGEARKP